MTCREELRHRGALGLSQFNVLLNPLADAPSGLSDFIGFVTALLQGGMDSPQLDPQSGIEDALKCGSFQLASGSDLMNIVMGNPGNLVTYSHPDFTFLDITPDAPSISLPAFSILGILNGTFEAAASFHFTGTAAIGLGIDTSGLYADTAATHRHLCCAAWARRRRHLGLNCGGHVDDPGKVLVGPDITTTASLGLKDTSTNGANKARLADLVNGLDPSQGLSNLGAWLQKDVDLKIDVAGSIDLTFTVNTPIKGVITALPEPVSEALEPFAQAAGTVIDFLSGAVETVCDVVEDVPIFGSLIKELVNCHDVKTVAQIVFGEYVALLVPLADKLGADPTKTALSSDGQSANLVWSFPIVNFEQDLNSSRGSPRSAEAAANNPNASDPSTSFTVQVQRQRVDLDDQRGRGDGQRPAHQSRRRQRRAPPLGRRRERHLGALDPGRACSSRASTQVNATMNDSRGQHRLVRQWTRRSTSTPPSQEEAGDETIKTGAAGNDTVHGGAGTDTIDGGDGNNVLYAGSGKTTLIGGAGRDELRAGPGGGLLEAGSGTEFLYGGSGDDRLIAGSGTDELHGGGGNDTFVAGSGPCTMDGEGGPNDTDTFTGGSGTVTMNGGQGSNIYHCGTGTTTIQGGPGSDLIYWDAGYGNATIDGGANSSPDTIDRLQMRGAPGLNDFTASANGAGVTVAAPGATVNATGINVLNIDGTGAAGTTVINDLSGTTIEALGLNLDEVDNPDGIQSQIILNGPSSPRTINVGEFAAQGNVVVNGTGTPVSGSVMLITGLGPTVLASDDDNAVTMNLGGGGNTVGISLQTLHGSLAVQGSVGGDTFNVQGVSGPTTITDKGSASTYYVGSHALGRDRRLAGRRSPRRIDVIGSGVGKAVSTMNVEYCITGGDDAPVRHAHGDIAERLRALVERSRVFGARGPEPQARVRRQCPDDQRRRDA